MTAAMTSEGAARSGDRIDRPEAASDALLRAGAEHHQHGRLDDAEALYSALLERHPGHPDALHLLGLIARARGQADEAIAAIGRALAVDPGHPAYHNSLGLALLDCGRTEKAIESFQHAIALNPDHVAALGNLGRAQRMAGAAAEAVATFWLALGRAPMSSKLHIQIGITLDQLDRKDEALHHFEKACALCPSSGEAWHNLALAQERKGALQAARASCQRAVWLLPQNPVVASTQGRLAAAEGRMAEAGDAFRRALALDPGLVEARLALAALLHDDGQAEDARLHYRELIQSASERPAFRRRLIAALTDTSAFEEAESSIRRLIELEPENLELRLELGNVLRQRGQNDSAIALLREVLKTTPDCAQAHNGLGIALLEAGRRAEARDCFERAAALAPDRAEIHNSLANMQQEEGAFDAALESYARAIALAPDYAQAHYNRARLLLLLGHYREGWREYDWRLALPESRSLPRPPAGWNGERPRAQRVVVVGEQGPGDVVLFAHCLPDLVADAAPVSLHVEPRLVDLLARSFPGVEVTARRPGSAPRPEAEGEPLSLPLGSLARIYRNSEASFAIGPRRYLVPDPAKLERWRKRLDALGPGLKIGFSWRGGKSPSEKHHRTTALQDWESLLRLPGAQFINLQYGDCGGEIDALRARHGLTLHDWSDLDPLADLDDFTALIDSLDLVVSMANTSVHFAGALAKPTWALVPLAPSWRWQHARDNCPWYPSVRLIRLQPGEDWADLARRTADALARALANPCAATLNPRNTPS